MCACIYKYFIYNIIVFYLLIVLFLFVTYMYDINTHAKWDITFFSRIKFKCTVFRKYFLEIKFLQRISLESDTKKFSLTIKKIFLKLNLHINLRPMLGTIYIYEKEKPLGEKMIKIKPWSSFFYRIF